MERFHWLVTVNAGRMAVAISAALEYHGPWPRTLCFHLDSIPVPTVLHWDDETCCLEIANLIYRHLRGHNHHQETTPSSDCVRVRKLPDKRFAKSLRSLATELSLLDDELDLKISDFVSASPCGAEPSASQARFRHPDYDWNAPPIIGSLSTAASALLYNDRLSSQSSYSRL